MLKRKKRAVLLLRLLLKAPSQRQRLANDSWISGHQSQRAGCVNSRMPTSAAASASAATRRRDSSPSVSAWPKSAGKDAPGQLGNSAARVTPATAPGRPGASAVAAALVHLPVGSLTDVRLAQRNICRSADM